MYGHAKVLILTTDTTIDIAPIERRLVEARHVVATVPRWQGTLRELYNERPHALMLVTDAMNETWWAKVQAIRELSDIPLIVVTTAAVRSDLRKALDLGLDGFFTLPNDQDKIIARLALALRRVWNNDGVAHVQFQQEELSIDWRQFEVRVDGQAVRLSPTEFKLLSLLVERQDEVVPYHEILSRVWGPKYTIADRHYVKLYIWYLRRKLEQVPARPTRILTRPGIGYMFRSQRPATANAARPETAAPLDFEATGRTEAVVAEEMKVAG